MSEIVLPFGQFAPDQPGLGNPGAMVATNFYPGTNSFRPFRGLTTISSAITERCLGAVSCRDASDDTFVYAGDENRLWEMVNNTFTEESSAAAVYNTATDDNWEFAVWNENNRIIATNFTDPVQSMAIGAGTTSAFADMITTPAVSAPRAKHIAIVERFVVLGWINDSDGVTPNRVRWSARENEADFAPLAATQADYEDLATGGVVQRIIGGTSYGLIFQNDMVRTMRYVGGGPVFELTPINYAPGTPIPNSVISYQGNVFYITEAGFMGMRGVEVIPVGTNRIDRYFWNQFDITNRKYLSASIDPINKVVAWAFPGAGATSNLPNRIIMCKWDELKWTEAVIDTELILATETQGYTLDGLDVLGTDIDNATIFDESLDSEKWRGRSFRFAAFDQSHRLSYFTGATLAATLETGDIQLAQGRRSQINNVLPLVDGGDARVSIASRQRLKDAVSYGTSSDMNINGICPVRSEGIYHRFRVSLSASTSWSHLTGLGVDYVGGGLR